MHKGTCVRCGSDQVYKSLNGIISGEKYVYVRNLTRFTPRSSTMTYLCATCGYYENYITDEKVLAGVRLNWEKA
ncbi:MAG TPA: hypothetical protein PK926_09735 [Spirochaetota bacterium]|nr:hypothetical protein [Spirochaetota bacterium]HPI88808.1 hypothetical protein [Spirochaetota bacterium]HPR47704.1 hypothetical protein [Spirochaetota bacterium]